MLAPQLLTLFSLLTIGLSTPILDLSTPILDFNTDNVPKLPEGRFAGSNNADGTSTLRFFDTNQTITYKPKYSNESKRAATGLNKRAPGEGGDCWGFELNHQGVDKGIQQFKNLFSWRSRDQGRLGQNAVGFRYFGYNNDGVYVYFCVNTHDDNYTDQFNGFDLNRAYQAMDVDCGNYMAGYWHWNSPSIFGKTRAGDAVCLA